MTKVATQLKASWLLAIIMIAVVPTIANSPNYSANGIMSSESTLANESNSVAANGDLTAASGSNRFVAWSDATSGNTEILFRRSTDNGATWKPIVNLSNTTGSSSNPSVMVSGSTVYVVWEDSSPGASDIFVLRSTDNGATWKAVKNLSDNAGDSSKPQIAVFGANVYVTWEDETPGSLDILFIRSTDNGATWKAIKNLSNNADSSRSPRIAISGSNVYVVWYDDSPGNFDILSRQSTDGGATWKSLKNLSNDEFVSRVPRIAVSGSNVYVVWEGLGDDGELFDAFLRRSTDNGATWKAVKVLTTIPGESNLPRVAVSGSNVYVVWFQSNSDSGNSIVLRRSTDNGATWKAVKNLSNITGQDPPEIAASGSDVYVVWYDSPLGNPDILFRRSTDNGAAWKAVKNLSNNAGDSTNPQVAVSSSSVFVTWEDDTPGNLDILNRRSIDAGVTWNTIRNLSNNAGSSTSPQLAR